MSRQTMGEFLAVLRKANGYTQQEVAEKLNISNRTLSSWETDRTTPDILLLPAIADLYGVTADEILRGERGESEKSTTLSDKAMRSVHKLHYSKFCFKNSFLTPFGCFSTLFFILATILFLYTNARLWVDILLAVLSLSGIVTCGILLLAFYNKAKTSIGVVLSDDYTDDKKACVLALKRKTQNYFWICALPFIIFTVILLIIYNVDVIYRLDKLINEAEYYVPGKIESFEILALKTWHKPYIITIVSNAIIGIGLFIAFIVFSNVGIGNLLNDEQKEIRKSNLKLLRNICLWALIPYLGLFAGLWTVYLYIPTNFLAASTIFAIIFPTVLMAIIVGIIHTVKRQKPKYEFV